MLDFAIETADQSEGSKQALYVTLTALESADRAGVCVFMRVRSDVLFVSATMLTLAHWCRTGSNLGGYMDQALSMVSEISGVN